MFDQQFGDAFELVQEPRCKRTTAFAPIKPCRLGEIVFRPVVKRVCQESSTRNRATASGPETGVDSPRSISASRFAARLSQARSRALSASRLAITRSRSRSRAAVGRRRTSSSKASTGSGILGTSKLVVRSQYLATSRFHWHVFLARMQRPRPPVRAYRHTQGTASRCATVGGVLLVCAFNFGYFGIPAHPASPRARGRSSGRR